MKIGFLGCGKMASALLEGVVHSGAIETGNLAIYDRSTEVTQTFAARTGVQIASSSEELAGQCAALVLCVKPGDAQAALAPLQPALAGKLVISIMAGIPLARLQEMAGPTARLVRVMPNTPALIRQGASAYSLGETATEADAQLVEKIFRSVGTIARVPEKLIDSVTGLSGSGPAYVYLIIEALADAGVLVGLPRDLSLQLAAQTVAGSAAMVLQTGQHPAQLKDAVTSPGGTTIAGLEALEKNGLRAALLSAVRTATARSKELGA
ncbi:MAG: pyrroline-5-carboxylate reductase [Chthoniobacteraceae bacterium]